VLYPLSYTGQIYPWQDSNLRPLDPKHPSSTPPANFKCGIEHLSPPRA